MKTSLKKLISVTLAVMMLLSVVTASGVSAVTVDTSSTGADTVYLDASGASDGNEDYWAWIWNNGSEGSWNPMSIDSSGYWTVAMDSGQNVVFVRVAAGVAPEWSSDTNPGTVWNQTGDLVYDGTNNLCTVSWSDTYGGELVSSWSYYDNGSTPIPTIPLPTTPVPTTQAPTTSPVVTQTPTTVTVPVVTTSPKPTVPTDPTEPDEDQNLYVSAKSNINTAGVKTKVSGNAVTVTYSLTAPEVIDDGRVRVYYDSSKLMLSTVYNTQSSMFPVVKNAVYNLNAGVGMMMFDFSSIGEKYDFTNGGVLVSLVFEKKTDSTVGTASVYMDVMELNSESVTYVEDSLIKEQGVSVEQAVEEKQLVDPTEEQVATNETNNLSVNVSSNLNSVCETVNATKRNVKVTYSLTVPEMIAFGSGTVVYDSDKLALESMYNPETSMFTTISQGVVYSLNAGTGTMKFSFTGVSEDKQTGLYDFKDGSALVTLVFTIRSTASGDAGVYLSLDELGSFDTDYISQGAVNAQGVSCAATVADENSTAVTTPTESQGVSTTPSDTSATFDTSATSPSDTGVTYPSQTESTEATAATQATNPPSPKPTSPASKAPYLAKSKLTKKAGSTYRIEIKNKGNKKASFSTSNGKILKVSSKGKVTFLKKGKATITVKIGSAKLKFTGTVSSNPKLVYKGKTVKAKKYYPVKKGKTITVKISGKAKALKNVYTSTKKAKIKGKTTASKVKIRGLRKGKTTLKIKVNRSKVLKLRIKVK